MVSEKNFELFILQVESFHFINYSYILKEKEHNNFIVIDPAWEIAKYLEILKNCDTKVSILLTHSHYDHVNLVQQLCDLYDCRVFISKQEQEYYNVDFDNLVIISDEIPFVINSLTVEPFFTPGHTKGSLCYLIQDCFFAGDTLFYEGVGSCDSYGSNHEDLFYSIQRLKQKLKPNYFIYSGHSFGQFVGKPYYDILNQNISLQIENKESFLKFNQNKSKKNKFAFV